MPAADCGDQHGGPLKVSSPPLLSDRFCPICPPNAQLIEKTNMVDYAVDIYQQLNGTEEVRERQPGKNSACKCLNDKCLLLTVPLGSC